ncbi:MAG TPA: sigma-70 family RNA polymerase sigma factor [Bacteroidota bacterium]|nr:sigma-70 family RNA polymerase sigma factor [Bacteroidota bacterium]
MTATSVPVQDNLLIQRSKAGDHGAFRELYDQNVAPLFRFMRQFSDNQEQVEDWVQRAFIKAYENLHRFDGISLFSTWLFKLALNEMRMDFRRARILTFIPAGDRDDEGPEENGSAFEWDMTMKQWLSELDETKRVVFLLYEVEGYSHAEVAAILHIKESTSRTLLTRTKQFLRKRWEEERKAI